MRHAAFLASILTVVFALLAVPSASGQDDRGPTQAVGMLSVETVPEEVKQAARRAVWGPADGDKNGSMSRLGTELALLYHQHKAGGERAVQALWGHSARTLATEGPDRQQRMYRVYSPLVNEGQAVVVDAIATGFPGALLDDLQALGLERGHAAGAVVSGRLPIKALREAAQLATLRGMIPSYMRIQAGSVGSEADTAHQAAEARVAKGADGTGQKVCALSDSYDTATASTSASDDVESGDLPGSGNPESRTTSVQVLQDYDGSDPDPTDEGRAMLQLIHDIAPGARLGFHTAFGGLGNFAEGIGRLSSAGCGIIVDDVSYSSEPFYQDGPVANAIDSVVTNEDVAYFSSAGNSGQNSYEAPFRNSGEPGVISRSSVRHDFDDGTLSTDTKQQVTVEDGGTFQVFSFQWTDPAAFTRGARGPDTDLDIALVDRNGTIVAESSSDNIATGVPFETMEYTNDSGSAQTLNLVIEKAAGPDPDEIKYIYSGRDFDLEEHNSPSPTIFGHPMAEGAMAVAAAPFYYTERYCSLEPENCLSQEPPPYLEPFSSKGGIPIRFDESGTPISPVTREKPDVTGTDGIDNTFFGTDIDDASLSGVDPDANPNFFGTSAAAPNVAAVAALIRQARSTLSPRAVYDRLESNTTDVMRRINEEGRLEEIGTGWDPWSGHGFVQANQAVPVPRGVQIVNFEAAGAPESSETTLRWQLIGRDTLDIDRFEISRRFFDGTFTSTTQSSGQGFGQYTQQIEDLPLGTHRFRIEAFTRIDTTGDGSPDTDSLVASNKTNITLRGQGVDVKVYPNPFDETARLSVTLPESRENRQVAVQIRVYDALGRRVAIPVVSRTIDRAASIRLGAATLQALSGGVYFFQVVAVGADGNRFRETARAVHVP